MPLSRRSLLGGSALVGAALSTGVDVWRAAPAFAGEKTLDPVRFGPASLTSEQSVMDVAVSGTTAYLAGDTYGEVTPGPLRPTAQVAALDIVTRRLLWREEIKPDWASYESVHVVGNLLYAMARRPRGAWFAYDLTTRGIVMEGDLGGYGQFNGVDGRVFSWVHWTNDISELPTAVGGSTSTVYDNVPRGWYNNPMFNFTRSGRSTWGMRGTDLALFPLPRAA
ncbi:hypothetical protein [Streptomyces sp. NBC_01618]|uniref:hypothetical protein n=1 Tax=Streptomyces sp. NBC_01618 TaxID=2975900 RepID=UPI00386F4EF5|nr:hypothetical protein OH735_35300 [Streptomyces sp. NBC_01618]